MTYFFGKTFRTALIYIILAELLSICGFLVSELNMLVFFAITGLTLALAMEKLEYGILILLAELFIGSKGYLFSFEYGGLSVSLRIALWLVVMAVWAGRMITGWMRNRKMDFPPARSEFFPYFAVLFIFILSGTVIGVVKDNRMSDLFFDLNGWLYFTLLFPVLSVFAEKDDEGRNRLVCRVMQVFTAAVSWLALKTFLLLFIFSHNLRGMLEELYRWVRVTGVGEITLIQGGFYRIFLQSHIFVLIALFIFLAYLAYEIKTGAWKKKDLYAYAVAAVLALSIMATSFSRSFWVGIAAGSFLFGIFLLREKYGFKKISQIAGVSVLAAVLGFLLLVSIVKFPYPNPIGGFNTGDLFSERATEVSGEAGASSRWALLPELTKKIKASPVLGGGFGATVTYKTQDPRVLASSPTGEYTTYAFEWGWLDIWLKLGLFGLLSYAVLIAKVFIAGIKKKITDGGSLLYAGLAIGLAALCAVSFFSPYTNHPLGIGYLIIASAIIGTYKDN